MTFTLKINMDNAAFEDNQSHEVARILAELSARIAGHPDFTEGHSQPIKDINGNEVGYFDIN